MNAPYEPDSAIATKIARRLVPLRARRPLRFVLDKPIVSFTFDDFPLSAISNGARVIEDQGWLGTFYTSAGLMGTANHHGKHFSKDDLLALQASGHEIAGHTHNHVDCSKLTLEEAISNIEMNAAALQAMGVNGVRNFAYPYGTMTAPLKRTLEARFRSMRGVLPGAHYGMADLNGLKSSPLFTGQIMVKTVNTIKGLNDKPGWLILFAHDIRERPSEWGCTPLEFQYAVRAVKAYGAEVLTVDAALDRLEAQNG